MDPLLATIAETGARDEEIEAIVRLTAVGAEVPQAVREVARFGDIRTVRLRRGDVPSVWAHPRVASLKAPRLLQFDAPWTPDFASSDFLFEPPPGGDRLYDGRDVRTVGVSETGAGVVVGVVDWGFDFAGAAMRTPGNGASRILSLWDQRADEGVPAPKPFGYGRVFSRRDINASLQSPAPYRALGYHPGDADRGAGAHGTHVTDIAAGTRRGTNGGGVAPGADLALVHLSNGPLGGLADLGDSVRLLEAVAHIVHVAGDRPLVINLSVGRHGGPHTGLTLVERAFDRLLEARPATMICQSAGNYRQARAHASGHVAPGRTRRLRVSVKPRDRTGNEIEIWYSNRDRFGISLTPPGSETTVTVPLGESYALRRSDRSEIGRLYHRAFDPNTPDHLINIFLNRTAPAGEWRIDLTGERIADGRFNAWIERDSAGRRGQSEFVDDVDTASTIGSICNGILPIAVGAANVSGGRASPAPFASAGPTRDGRMKPDVSAPGVRVVAARNTPQGGETPIERSTRMSGASQAAPYVAGLVALLLERAAKRGEQLSAHDIRRRIIGTAIAPTDPKLSTQLGAGLVAPPHAIGALVRTHPIQTTESLPHVTDPRMQLPLAAGAR